MFTQNLGSRGNLGLSGKVELLQNFHGILPRRICPLASFYSEVVFGYVRDGFTGGGGAGGCTPPPPSPGQVGCRGGAIFMIKQKNMRDIMKYTL